MRPPPPSTWPSTPTSTSTASTPPPQCSTMMSPSKRMSLRLSSSFLCRLPPVCCPACHLLLFPCFALVALCKSSYACPSACASGREPTLDNMPQALACLFEHSKMWVCDGGVVRGNLGGGLSVEAAVMPALVVQVIHYSCEPAAHPDRCFHAGGRHSLRSQQLDTPLPHCTPGTTPQPTARPFCSIAPQLASCTAYAMTAHNWLHLAEGGRATGQHVLSPA